MKLVIFGIILLFTSLNYSIADDSHANTIGVILPLTGKQANVAQRTLRGIQVGLGLHNPQS